MIEVLDEERIDGYVFRVARMVNGACQESLPCRVELGPDGFTLSFYGRHGMDDARMNRNPLTKIPLHLWDLVGQALVRAKRLQQMWEETA